MRIGLPESRYPFSTIPHRFLRSSATRAAATDRRVRSHPTPVSEDLQ
jgi:hypothetical protein